MKTRTKNMRPGWRPARGLLSLLVLAALGALVLAGCGSSSSSSSEAAATTSATAGSSGGESGESGGAPGGFEISEEAQTCLKEQGVELPEGGQGGPPNGGEIPEGGEPPAGGPPNGEIPGGGNFKKMEEAFKTCGIEMQGRPGGAGPGQNSAAFKTQVKEYVACVKENGYELPEPNLSGNGPVFDESKVNQEDPAFKKASSKCQSLLRGSGPAGGEASESESESS